MKLEDKGLVLEGGGMRGAYTAGVLDYLMRQNVEFPYVIGVSAGANNGANYVAKQRERNKKVFVDMVTDQRYLGLKNLIKDGNYFGMDFLFKKLPNELVPFDYDTFGNSPITFKVVTTNCRTVQTEYFDKEDFDPRFFGENILRASSSIPVLTKPVKINGECYFDGGITDSIPLEKAIKDGYENNVVILTKHKGFRLKYRRSRIIFKLLLRDYPQLADSLKNRYKIYNNCIEWVEKLEEEGKIFIFRPHSNIEIGGLESNPENLKEIYDRGYEETKNRFAEFKKWNQEKS
ncbi:MAG: patatin family protein [Halanaerobiales bacterium]